MAGFLKQIVGGGKKHISTSAADTALPVIAEIPCDDGISISIRAQDSSYNLNRVPTFARKYDIYAKADSEQKAEALATQTGKNIAADGSVHLDYVFGNDMLKDWVPQITATLKKANVTLNEAAVYDAIAKDMAQHREPAPSPAK